MTFNQMLITAWCANELSTHSDWLPRLISLGFAAFGWWLIAPAPMPVQIERALDAYAKKYRDGR